MNDVTLTEADKSEVLRYLGYKGGEIDEKTKDDIDECIQIANEFKDVRFVWRLFDMVKEESSISFADTNVTLYSKVLSGHLKDSKKAVLGAVTLGGRFDEEINRLMISNPSKGVILNSCAITLVEKAADELEKEIMESCRVEKLTPRFSPGYGDLSIESQTDFINLLDTERKIGVRLNRNMMMNPTKSVTFIVGL